MLTAVGVTKKALIVTPAVDAKLVKSAANIPGVKTTTADNINTYEVLNGGKFVILSLIHIFGMMKAAVRNSSMRLHISFDLPRKGELWLFVPVFLGISLACSLGTSTLQRFLESYTAYQTPESVRLPKSGFAMLLRCV